MSTTPAKFPPPRAHLRDQARDDPTLGLLLVVGRDDVTVEVALRGLTTPLAVTEWRRLPAKVRQALPTAEDLTRPCLGQSVKSSRLLLQPKPGPPHQRRR
jgi:hypothetical protein